MDDAATLAAICHSGQFLDSLDLQKVVFVDHLYAWIGPPAKRTMTIFAILWIIIWGFKVIIADGDHKKQFRTLIYQLLLFTFISAQLVPLAGAHPFIFDWFIFPLESAVSNISLEIINIFISSDFQAASAYGKLSCVVELRMAAILTTLFHIITDNDTGWLGVLSGAYFVVIAAFIVLSIPIAMIMAIFASFLAEMLFKVVAIGAISPILLVFAAFKPLRPAAIGGLRIVAGGFYTVMLASVALGFTLVTLEMQGASLTAALQPKIITEKQIEATEKRYQDCINSNSWGSVSGRCIALNRELTRLKGSCPIDWCNSVGVAVLISGWFGRVGQAATAGSPTRGSSLKGAMVSRVM